jgi:tetratricopeptide (TPR) repeat protein
MLETIRQFAEDQLVAGGAATEIRAAHARYFAGREADIMALWDSPRQREAYDWFAVELANLRTAFRWAADHDDLDDAATIATDAGLLGLCVESYEPIAWAEELIEPARAVDHPRLAFLYVIASLCWLAGRIEAAIGYSDAGLTVLGNDCDELPYGIEGFLGIAYLVSGQPERTVEWCRAQLARGRDTHTLTRAALVVALTMAGCPDDAMAAANGLIESAEATRNPFVLSFALLDYGFAFRHTDPDRAHDALRRGLVIARDSGNRSNETHLAGALSHREAEYGDPLAALEYSAVAIHHYHDAGSTANMRAVLAALAACLDGLGRYEPAATIAGFGFDPLTALRVPELSTTVAHLRDVLGDQTYESLARKGETLTAAAMATYAYDQIDQARAQLEAVSK